MILFRIYPYVAIRSACSVLHWVFLSLLQVDVHSIRTGDVEDGHSGLKIKRLLSAPSYLSFIHAHLSHSLDLSFFFSHTHSHFYLFYFLSPSFLYPFHSLYTYMYTIPALLSLVGIDILFSLSLSLFLCIQSFIRAKIHTLYSYYLHSYTVTNLFELCWNTTLFLIPIIRLMLHTHGKFQHSPIPTRTKSQHFSQWITTPHITSYKHMQQTITGKGPSDLVPQLEHER